MVNPRDIAGERKKKKKKKKKINVPFNPFSPMWFVGIQSSLTFKQLNTHKEHCSECL